MRLSRRVGIFLFVGLVGALTRAAPPDDAADARSLGVSMARDLKAAVKSRYFDAEGRAPDFDEIFRGAETRVRQATSQAQVAVIMAQTLSALGDSHTFFIPPIRAFEVDHGFEAGVVGEALRVLSVAPGSDADKKGVRLGDRILKMEGAPVNRSNWAEISYAVNVVLPRKQVALSLQTDELAPREVLVEATVTERPRKIAFEEWFDDVAARFRKNPRYAWRYWTYEKEKVVVAKLYSFMITDDLVNKLMDKIHDARALILDLRGNPGGSVDALQIAAGAFFEDEIQLGTQRDRKSTKPLKSKRPKSKRLFAGDLVVLVDAATASSAEILARVIQIEKRGAVVGDRTAGTVMLAEHLSLAAGNAIRLIPYGASVTVADLLMKDGQRLEGRGVEPDEVIVPTPADLREYRDPAMARAAAISGLELSPEAAWSHFNGKPDPPKDPADKP